MFNWLSPFGAAIKATELPMLAASFGFNDDPTDFEKATTDLM